MNVDISWELPECFVEKTESFSFGLLTFKNVRYTMSDEITLSGPSDPKDINEKFKPFNVIAARARNVMIIESTGFEKWYKKHGVIQSAT